MAPQHKEGGEKEIKEESEKVIDESRAVFCAQLQSADEVGGGRESRERSIEEGREGNGEWREVR